MYSHTGIRCTFLYHDLDHRFHKKIIWQPVSGVIILGTLPTAGNRPSYHPAKSKRDDEPDFISIPTPKRRQNYGYSKIDDALAWFYRNTLDLDEENNALLEMGSSDDVTIANITVTIKYTTEFAQTLGVYYRHGLLMVAGWTIDVCDSNTYHYDFQKIAGFFLLICRH